MAFLLLPNAFGANSTAAAADSATVMSGYDIKDLHASARNYLVPFDAKSGAASWELTNADAAADYDYVVITRADLLVQNDEAMDVEIQDKPNAGSYSTVSGTDITVIDGNDLLGIDKFEKGYGQDLLIDAGGTRSKKAVKFYCDATNSAQRTIAGMMACKSFDIGSEPVLNPLPRWEKLTGPVRTRLARPLHGYFDYATEAVITLTWSNLTAATYQSLIGQTHLFSWPLYLYDSVAALWSWQLEHVIVTEFSSLTKPNGYTDVTIVFQRLEHYR